MEKRATFGNVNLAKKMTSQFGASSGAVNVTMCYAKEVRTFIQKVEDAHRKAEKSKLVFG